MALVRLKRRFNELPAEVLLIACKRICISHDSAEKSDPREDVSSIFTFAGTLENKDKIITPQIATVLKESSRKNPKERIVNILERTRKANVNNKRNNRFKLVNSYRTSENIELDSAEKPSDLNLPIYDVENEDEVNDLKNAPFVQVVKECSESAIVCNGTELVREKLDVPLESESYVYDLYYTTDFNEDGLILDHTFFIERYFDPVTTDYRDDASEHTLSDDEDSNAEDYYTNDYPEDDSGSERKDPWEDYDEGISDMLECTHLSKFESSDEDKDSEPEPSEEDVHFLGADFAQYKAKALKALEKANLELDGLN